MTVRTIIRRCVTGGLAGAALAVVTVLATPGTSAGAPAGIRAGALAGTRAPGRGHHQAAAGTAASPVPAPPRPTRVVPQQRVLTGTALTGTARPVPTNPAPRSSRSGGTRTTALASGPVTATAGTPQGLPTGVPVVTANASGTGVTGTGTARTLVLYDSTGPYAWLGEVYGTLAANLVSHFGAWTAHPVGGYTAGELSGYSAVVYLGSTYDEPLPVAFLDDVLATQVPVVWVYDNIWQLTARQPDFATRRGFIWRQFDFSAIAEVRYRGAALTRDTVNGSGVMDHLITDPAKVSVLGDAVRPDGSTLPWALRSGNLTYVGEIPFAYMTHDDRYLAFADLLFDALAPGTGSRHRALVRIEDVGPDADPAQLRAIGDYLASKHVPFTVAVYPRYRDPKGVYNNGRAEDYTLRARPLVVSALKYLQQRGGTLLMHGYTHQYASVTNPYDAVSGNDFEFYAAHVDAADNVVYDGPVPGDSATWASARLVSASNEFRLAGLATPTMFEFPHYAGSVADYRAVAARFGTRYERTLYFPGALSGAAPDYTRLAGQFFPYSVRDAYGTRVVPENLGNVEPDWYNNHPPRLPADLLASARRNLAVRDGVASFFYHPYLGTAYLKSVVEGIQGMGYTFVPASSALG